MKQFKVGDILERPDRVYIIKKDLGDNKYKIDRFTYTDYNVNTEIYYFLYANCYKQVANNYWVFKLKSEVCYV